MVLLLFIELCYKLLLVVIINNSISCLSVINDFPYEGLATVIAMTAFRLTTTHPFHAELSTLITIYCYVFCTICIFCVLFVTHLRMTTIILVRKDTFIFHFLFIVQMTLSALATSGMCLLQVIRRQDYLRLINNSVILNELFVAKTNYKKTAFFDPYCLRLYNTRVAVTHFSGHSSGNSHCG